MNSISSAAWTMTGTFLGEPITLIAAAERYQNNNRPAILLYVLDEDGTVDLFSDLTINAPEVLLPNEERQVIVSHDASREVLTMAIESGLLEAEPEMVVCVGMTSTHAYRLTDSASEWVAIHAPA